MNFPEADWPEFASSHPDWERDGESISRTFVFSDFTGSVGFVVRVGFLAEAANHHPDIDIRWNRVTLVLSTHEAGALTALDTSLAAAIDELV
ncbi:MAG: 4a-hydroxytetrahydrobiopterin dehydratase [Acidimicrobiia bacterium]